MPSLFPPITAGSIRELAGKLELDADVLEKTISEFNAGVRPGTFNHADFDDCRTEGVTPPKTHWARMIETAPFYAYPVRPGITFTYLGVRVNLESRMLMANGKPAANMFRRDHVRQCADQGLCRRDRHDDRQRLGAHGGTGSGEECAQLTCTRPQPIRPKRCARPTD
jgi:hypothetical protein